ncbi:MAG: hypothetical protein SOW66_06645 [Porphyromonas sp.]|nr:hypothetical protein [Porphyromonas sp.]
MKRLLSTALGLVLGIASLAGQTPQKDEWEEWGGGDTDIHPNDGTLSDVHNDRPHLREL